MWIRGQVRLAAVALLGIEITIIALASTASADTHPDGEPAASSPYETGLHHADALEALSDVMGPEMDEAWTLQRLLMGRDDLQAMREWPLYDHAWSLADMRGAQEHSVRPSATEVRARTDAAQQPSQALTAQQPSQALAAQQGSSAQQKKAHRPKVRHRAAIGDRRMRSGAVATGTRARTGVARMAKARPHTLHRRASVDLTRLVPRQAAVPMSHATAAGWLKSAGLRTKSTGHCTSKHVSHCTSLDKVRTGTIARLISLKRESHCPILVTGGTEAGHAPGRYSHGNGYKIDISHNSCIDRYITKNRRSGIRGDGARLYRSAAGTTFADEIDHWDILFR